MGVAYYYVTPTAPFVVIKNLLGGRLQNWTSKERLYNLYCAKLLYMEGDGKSEMAETTKPSN